MAKLTLDLDLIPGTWKRRLGVEYPGLKQPAGGPWASVTWIGRPDKSDVV